MIKLNYTYNWQTNNYSWFNKYPGWAQCFSTSSCMFLSSLIPNFLLDDEFIKKYVDNVEVHVGEKGLGEKLILKYDWIAQAAKKGLMTSQWWYIQRDAIQIYLQQNGINFYDIIFKENDGTWEEVSAALRNGSPVILGTVLPPTQGHIILIVGETDSHWICADPYGSAMNLYKVNPEIAGKDVLYDKQWLKLHTEEKVTKIKNRIRIMYAKDKNQTIFN